MTWLTGKRTYIVAALMGLATAAKMLGYLTEDQYHEIEGLLVAGAAVTIRSALTRQGGTS